ncbi:MAG: YkgJ family cysteine cluster protein [Lachnospiraceae bacterium]|nr:YkgJ family cysteine cluster protein [Lachnospiraceae bacterium]
MKREISLEAFTDGKLYTKNDMVKVGCGDCRDCCDCCQGMGDSIVLDPYDIHQLTTNLHLPLEELLSRYLALHVVDGIILPSIKLVSAQAMVNAGSEIAADSMQAVEVCPFLNHMGRCSIHTFRPGFCRLFPLGRYYVNGTFQYILQNHECPKENKTKIKVQKWLGISNLRSYENFVNIWHYFLVDMEALLETSQDEAEKKTLNLYLLNTFFKTSYSTNDFYGEFQERLTKAKSILL